MTEEQAKEILGTAAFGNNSWFVLNGESDATNENPTKYIGWIDFYGDKTVCLDVGSVNVDQLRAIIWWIENK